MGDRAETSSPESTRMKMLQTAALMVVFGTVRAGREPRPQPHRRTELTRNEQEQLRQLRDRMYRSKDEIEYTGDTNVSTAPDEYKILLEKTKLKKLQEEKEIRKLHAEKENTKPFQNEQLSSGRRRLPDQRRDRATERLARHCGNLWASTKAKIAALQRGFQAALLPQTDESPTA